MMVSIRSSIYFTFFAISNLASSRHEIFFNSFEYHIYKVFFELYLFSGLFFFSPIKKSSSFSAIKAIPFFIWESKSKYQRSSARTEAV